MSPEELRSVQEHLGYHSDSLVSVQITGKKPNFEVGSSSQLKLSAAKKSAPTGKTGRSCRNRPEGHIRNGARDLNGVIGF